MAIIDWASLRHAYGPAADIPALLARARTAPPPARYDAEPWFALWSALYHQGDVYSASYAAAPELIAIAAERGGPAAAECLLLAASIELRRNEPAAPELPPGLRASYEAAVQAAADLARTALASSLEGDDRARLEVADAVFRGDHSRARTLLGEDGDADSA
jgi:hypothetical protein